MERKPRRSIAVLLPAAVLTAALAIFMPIIGMRPSCPAFAGTISQESTAGADFSGELARGQSRIISLDLKSSEYLQLAITLREGGLVLSLVNPKGLKVFDDLTIEESPVSMSAVSSGAGKHILEIKPAYLEVGSVVYRIRINARRPMVPADRQRMRAEQNYFDAMQLEKQFTPESDRSTLQKLDEASRLYEEIGDLEGKARILCRQGDLLHDRARIPEALVCFESALRISQNARNQAGMADALARIGLAQAQTGQMQKALQGLERALISAQAASDDAAIARALANTGEAYYWMGRQREALRYYWEAERLWTAIGDRLNLARILRSLGAACRDLSKIPDSLKYLNQSFELCQATGDRRGQANAIAEMVALFIGMGETQEAINRYHQAEKIYHDGNDPLGEAILTNTMAYAYRRLGYPEMALELYDKALRLFRQSHFRDAEAGQLMSIGEVYIDSGETSRALDYFEESLAIFREIQDRQMEAIALRDVGVVQQRLGQTFTAVDSFTQSLRLSQAADDLKGQAYALNGLGVTYQGVGNFQKAVSCLSEALALIEGAQFPIGEVDVRYNLAKAHSRSGNEAEALSQIESGIRIIESLRTKVDVPSLRISFFSTTRLNYDLYVDLLMKSHPSSPGEHRNALALAASERARARNLLDLLEESRAGIRQSIPPELAARERDLLRSLNAKAQQQARLMSGKHSREEQDTLAAEIRVLNTEYDHLQAEIRIRNPRYAALTQPSPLDLNEIQERVLDDHSLLLEYSLGEEHSWLWAVTRSDLASYELPPRSRIEPLARRVRELLTARQQNIPSESASQRRARALQADAEYWSAASELSRIILAPAADRLRTLRLLVVADGILQHIPFGALPLPSTEEANHSNDPAPAPVPLITVHQVVSMPSASALALLRQFAAGRTAPEKIVAILADPVYQPDDPRLSRTRPAPSSLKAGPGLPQNGRQRGEAAPQSTPEENPSYARLPFSGREAEYISALTPDNPGARWLGPEATRERATSPELARYRIVHFATHGVINDLHPNLSGVVLSTYDARGRGLDGFLRLHDIYNLNLPVELVVLSACNTGLGRDIRGEGLISLARGFMYAGAARVVASLWRVDDESTAELMRRFYRCMLKEKMPPAQALQAAQIEMSRHERWSAPYHWAGFVFHGEYR